MYRPSVPLNKPITKVKRSIRRQGPLALLAVACRQLRNGAVRQAFRLRIVENRRVRVETFRHLVADQVNQAFEDDVDTDVLLRRRFEELQT